MTFTTWRIQNNNFKSRLMVSLNGLKLYHNSNSGKQILYITGLYILLAVCFVNGITNKMIFILFGSLIYILEIINTVIEEIVDKISIEYNDVSKKIKDMSATVILIYMSLSYICLLIVIIINAFKK
jgi:undecaprenol kinase